MLQFWGNFHEFHNHHQTNLLEDQNNLPEMRAELSVAKSHGGYYTTPLKTNQSIVDRRLTQAGQPLVQRRDFSQCERVHVEDLDLQLSLYMFGGENKFILFHALLGNEPHMQCLKVTCLNPLDSNHYHLSQFNDSMMLNYSFWACNIPHMIPSFCTQPNFIIVISSTFPFIQCVVAEKSVKITMLVEPW